MNAQPIRNQPPSDEAGREALLDRIVPPIDEADPAWQAYVKAAVDEALADLRPDVPAEEVERRMRELHRQRRRRGA